ncbi:MAG: nucleotidyl transferase AbiEii/AbiGii toxin family protein [Eubacteriaceae bacterium]|nr:nucleotidyl transferase AbiEii/AbiGii toxin family protein [Oscillospiraceae bacterium]MBR4395234.1 nucleotidyl transferase AbiEii/AbiGii toxin family protein [Eubacteriaceae bacterium]
MKLHQDTNAFRVLLEQVHNRTGYRTDVLEKDYYVVLILHELAEKQEAGLPAYFKGGTALYKALRTTNRFSEDIDLSVDTRGCSRSQNDRRLEQAAKKYTTMDRDASSGRTNRSEVISFFTYNPITVYDPNDALQRFGKLKIEATSFTISEPIASLEIAPMVYDLASENEQRILREQYNVTPFSIMTITLERIFIDKLFAAEAYVRRSADSQRAFEAAKHIYDLAVMIRNPDIQHLLVDDAMVKRLLDIRIEEEAGRLDGIPGIMPQEFTFFETTAENNEVRKAYAVMQAQYVLRPEDRIDYDVAMAALNEILHMLMKSRAWTLYTPSEELIRQIQQQEKERLHPSPKKHQKSNDMER